MAATTPRRRSTSTMPARRVSFDVPLPRVPSVVPLEQSFGVPGHLDHLWITPAEQFLQLPDFTGRLQSATAAVAASRTLFTVLAAIATFGAGLAYSTYFQALGNTEPAALALMAWAWVAFIVCTMLSVVWQFVLAPDFNPLTPGRAFRNELTMFCVLVAGIMCLLAGTVLLSLALLPGAPSRVVTSAGYAVVSVVGILTFGSVLRFSFTVVRRSRVPRSPWWHSTVPMPIERDKPVSGPPPMPVPSYPHWDLGPRTQAQRRVTIEEPTTSRIGSHDIGSGHGFGPISPAGTLDVDARLTASPEPVDPDVANPSPDGEDVSSTLLSDDVALREFALAYSRLAYPLLAVRRRYPQFDGLRRAHRAILLSQTFKDMHRLSPIWYPVTGPNNAFDIDANGGAAVERFLAHLPRWEHAMNAVWFDGFHQLPPNEMTRYLLSAIHGIVPEPSLSRPARSHSV